MTADGAPTQMVTASALVAATPLRHLTSSTDFPAADHLRILKEMSRVLADIDVEPAGPSGGRWHVEGVRLGALALGENAFEDVVALTHRSPERVARDGLDMIRLLYCRSGRSWWGVEDREFGQGVGDIVVTDFLRPEWWRFNAQTSLILLIPRAALDVPERSLAHLHGLVLRPGGATHALLAAHLETLWAERSSLTDEEATDVAGATLALVRELLIKPSPARWEASLRQEALTARIMQFARDNLADPELGPARLCDRFGVSRAVLYRAFRPLGGVAAYIRALRLQKAYVTLRAPGPPPPLAQLSQSLGFPSVATFRDAFRRRYGFGPHETREASALRLAAMGDPRFNEPHMAMPAWVKLLGGR